MNDITTHDIHMLTSVIVAEARGETWLGKVAVAWIIVNRHARPSWWSREKDTVPDDTIAAVCVDSWQFSGLNTDDPNLRFAMILPPSHPVYLECQHAALTAVLGHEEDPTNGSAHYHHTRIKPDWAKGKIPVCTIGHHQFYNDID